MSYDFATQNLAWRLDSGKESFGTDPNQASWFEKFTEVYYWILSQNVYVFPTVQAKVSRLLHVKYLD